MDEGSGRGGGALSAKLKRQSQQRRRRDRTRTLIVAEQLQRRHDVGGLLVKIDIHAPYDTLPGNVPGFDGLDDLLKFPLEWRKLTLAEPSITDLALMPGLCPRIPLLEAFGGRRRVGLAVHPNEEMAPIFLSDSLEEVSGDQTLRVHAVCKDFGDRRRDGGIGLERLPQVASELLVAGPKVLDARLE